VQGIETQPTSATYLPIIRQAGDPTISTPTPDAPRELPGLRTEEEYYVVQAGDTLGEIARRYGVSLEALIQANELLNPDLLSVGEGLVIPAPEPGAGGTSFKVIPDSELVYGPRGADFDIAGFIQSQGGYLARYEDEVDDHTLSGAKVVARVAQEYSVNPRLLLAVLEYQSGWVRQNNPEVETLEYPLGNRDYWRKGLYLQLAWAANNLNRGFYQWRVNAVGAWVLADGSVVPVDPTINAGTAGVQAYFALLYDRANWDQAVSSDGVFAAFGSMFGYPFDYTVEPLLPPGLTQPVMQLPFEPEQDWAFTGGPHGGWGDGSAWAALDFAPPGEALGCVLSNDWVTAVADGLVVRAADGAVVQDLDGDGIEQSGWSVLYLHIDTNERVAASTFVRAGERLGHPSCEWRVFNWHAFAPGAAV
jgi:LysM repeat protein